MTTMIRTLQASSPLLIVVGITEYGIIGQQNFNVESRMITMKKLALAAVAAFGLSALAAGPAGPAEAADTELDKGSLALKYAIMTPIEVSHGEGIQFTVDGVEKGDVVTTDLSEKVDTVEHSGVFDGAVKLASEEDLGSTVNFTVTVGRKGEAVAKIPAHVDLIDGDRGDYENGTLLVGDETVTADEFAEEGMNLSMVNCSADDNVTFEVFRTSGHETSGITSFEQIAGDDKSAAVRFMSSEDVSDMPGTYTVTAECGDHTAKEFFNVTTD